MKTIPTQINVADFLAAIEPPQKQADCLALLALMEEITQSKAVIWGDNIIGFGDYHYKYASGREGDWFLCGFSPRKANITVYAMPTFEEHADLLLQLGKVKTSVSCIYLKKLADVNLEVLKTILIKSVNGLKEQYG